MYDINFCKNVTRNHNTYIANFNNLWAENKDNLIERRKVTYASKIDSINKCLNQD